MGQTLPGAASLNLCQQGPCDAYGDPWSRQCSLLIVEDTDSPRQKNEKWKHERGGLPGLEVPMGLVPLLEPGAPMGPPAEPKYSLGAGVGSYSVFHGHGGSDLDEGSPWRCRDEDIDEEDHHASLKESLAALSLQELMNAFVASMEGGVGLSMLFACIGILVLEVKLHLEPSLALRLKFNGIHRYVRLEDVEDLTVQRAHPGSNSGAWLVDLQLSKDGVCTFVFDSTEDGQREAHYFGGCLRSLVQGAHEKTSYPPPLVTGSGALHTSVRTFKRGDHAGNARSATLASRPALLGVDSPISLHALNVLTAKPQSVDGAFENSLCEGIEDFEAQIVAELSKYD